MKSKLICLVLEAAVSALSAVAEAQQSKIPRIGYLISAPLSTSTNRTEPFRRGLREVGYVEGKNISVECDLLKEVANVACTCRRVSQPQFGCHRDWRFRTNPRSQGSNFEIPIVMTQSDDPVGSGFALSLARPGRNITGLSQVAPELSGKRLELLKEIVPKLSRVAVLGTSTS